MLNTADYLAQVFAMIFVVITVVLLLGFFWLVALNGWDDFKKRRMTAKDEPVSPDDDPYLFDKVEDFRNDFT